MVNAAPQPPWNGKTDLHKAMTELYPRIQKSAEFIRRELAAPPEVAVVLGSGLGSLAEEVERPVVLPYEDLPNFPVSTAPGHSGRLVAGRLAGKEVLLLAGRFHYYEGYTMKQVTFPVRVAKALGVHTLLLTNAAGGTNPDFSVGDLIAVRDHISLMPENPLRGPNDERLGPRFPDMLHAYDPQLIALAQKVGGELGIPLKTGVYLGLPGPNLETPSEYQFAHRIGADLVGMSTVPEVIVARHAGLRVLVLSLVSNKCYPPEAIRATSVEDVLQAAAEAAPKLKRLVLGILERLEG